MNYPINYGWQHTSLFKMLKCTLIDILIGSVSKIVRIGWDYIKFPWENQWNLVLIQKFLNDVGENYRQHITATRISKYTNSAIFIIFWGWLWDDNGQHLDFTTGDSSKFKFWYNIFSKRLGKILQPSQIDLCIHITPI